MIPPEFGLFNLAFQMVFREERETDRQIEALQATTSTSHYCYLLM